MLVLLRKVTAAASFPTVSTYAAIRERFIMPHDLDNPAIEAAGKNIMEVVILSSSSIAAREDGHGSFEAVGKQSAMQREIEQQRESRSYHDFDTWQTEREHEDR